MRAHVIGMALGMLGASAGALAAAPAHAAVTFGAETTYTTHGGEGTDSVAIGDVNGDGIPDLVAANGSVYYSGTDLSVLLGTGGGAFGTATQAPLGQRPSTHEHAVALADMNGDHRLDAVVATGGKLVKTLLGDGTGGLGTPIDATTSSANDPTTVALGDVDGDGLPDAVAGVYDDGRAYVLLNLGDGTLANQGVSVRIYTQTPGGNGGAQGTQDVQLGDVNGDGRLDIVGINSLQNAAFVALGHGDGTFASPSRVDVAGSPTSLVLADFNGDGKLDFATADRYPSHSGAATVVLGNGDGTFGTPVEYAVGLQPIAIDVADFDLDGHPDLVTANSGEPDLSVLRGAGDGTFGTAINVNVPSFGGGNNPNAVSAGDLDGDGRPDLVTTTIGYGRASVFLNTSPVVTVSPVSHDFGDVIEHTTAPAADFTVTNRTHTTVTVQQPTSSDPQFAATLGAGCASIAAGATCAVQATVAPTATGPQHATLTIPTSSGSHSVQLYANGVASPAASLSTSSIDFGDVQAQDPTGASHTVTVHNTSASVTETVTWDLASGPFDVVPGDANATSECARTVSGALVYTDLGPGQDCTMHVRFRPATTGAAAATLHVSVGVPGGTSHAPQAPLVGAGDVALQGKGTAAVLSATRSQPSIDFGSRELGAPPLQRSITVTNTSPGASISVRGIADGPFSVPAADDGDAGWQDACSASVNAQIAYKVLAPNESCRVDVVLTPQDVGPVSGPLHIEIGTPGGTDHAPQAPLAAADDVTLAATVAPPTITVSPTTLAFATVNPGSPPTARTVTVTNTSHDASITVTPTTDPGREFTAPPADEGDAGWQDACFASVNAQITYKVLPPGATCTQDVLFTPGSFPGDTTATLHLRAGIPSGAGGAPEHAVDVATVGLSATVAVQLSAEVGVGALGWPPETQGHVANDLRSFGVRNTSDVAISIRVDVTGPFVLVDSHLGDAPECDQTTPGVKTYTVVVPGASCRVSLRISDATVGPANGTVRLRIGRIDIAGDPPAEPLVDVAQIPLTGSIEAPRPAAKAQSPLLAFGTHDVAETQHADLTERIVNTGNVPIGIGLITSARPFSVVPNAAALTPCISVSPSGITYTELPPGQACWVTVRFTPDAAGPANARMSIGFGLYAGPGGPSTPLTLLPDVTLMGTGTVKHPIPGHVTWPSVPVGSSQTQAIPVVNTTTRTEAVTVLPTSGEFTVVRAAKARAVAAAHTKQCALRAGVRTRLAPRTVCFVTVRFAPKRVGTARGKLHVRITGGRTLSATLRGVGVGVGVAAATPAAAPPTRARAARPRSRR